MTRAPGVSYSPDKHSRRVPVPPELRRQLPSEFVTSTKPFVDPTPTAPIQIGPSCPDCDLGKHAWFRVGSERMNDQVWLTRWRCACDHCGRCGAGSVGVDFEGPKS